MRRRLRGVAALAACALFPACVSETYRIPRGELERLAMTPPEARGQSVRVVQELSNADEPPAAQPVTAETQVVIVAPIDVDVGGSRGYGGGPHPIGPAPHGGGGVGGAIVGGGNAGNDNKAQAIVYLAIAASAAIVLAATEGERYDGWVQLHPMMPVHLWGPGGYTVVPLAQIDPNTAAWADRAVVVPGEGPWRELGRAPLDRQGWTYAVLLGASDVPSHDGNVYTGGGGHIQIGGFPTKIIGILGDFDFAWAPNATQGTDFVARAGLELDVLPIALGPLHGGLYGELGYVHRTEDVSPDLSVGDSGGRLEGGTLIQLAVTTRLALTARLGLGDELGATIRDLSLGLSIY